MHIGVVYAGLAWSGLVLIASRGTALGFGCALAPQVLLALLVIRLVYYACPQIEAWATDAGVPQVRRHVTWWITDASQALGFMPPAPFQLPRLLLSAHFRDGAEATRLVQLNGGGQRFRFNDSR